MVATLILSEAFKAVASPHSRDSTVVAWPQTAYLTGPRSALASVELVLFHLVPVQRCSKVRRVNAVRVQECAAHSCRPLIRVSSHPCLNTPGSSDDLEMKLAVCLWLEISKQVYCQHWYLGFWEVS